ncbi:hypothetical protein B0H11DRAFT_2215074 [Mycena galericulata]|nr:hypothetical protein B0H11DRAFT_2215074 [Mycena galericulata]
MAPKRWTTLGQHAYLDLQLPEYIRRQAEGKLFLFWGPMKEAWFRRYPEQAELGLPLPTDRSAAPLSDIDKAILGKAIKSRSAQLVSWFRREHKKLHAKRGQPTSVSAAAKLLAKKRSGKRSSGRRLHQAVEIFQKRNQAKIRNELSARGFDALNEAARLEVRAAAHGDGKGEGEGEDSDVESEQEESLEEQEAHVKESRSERMRLRVKVVSELWESASKEERAAVEKELAREKEELLRRQQEEEEGKGARTKTPEEYQQGVDALQELFEDAHKVGHEMAGWVGFTIVGGPTPRLDGNLTLKVICIGETPHGNSFQDACLDFNKDIVGPFQQFLQVVYTFQERDSRAILKPVIEDGGGEPASEEDEPVPAPAKKPPKRVPKPKAKKKAPQKSSNSPGTSGAGIDAADSGQPSSDVAPPASSIPIQTPPRALAASPAAGDAATTPEFSFLEAADFGNAPDSSSFNAVDPMTTPESSFPDAADPMVLLTHDSMISMPRLAWDGTSDEMGALGFDPHADLPQLGGSLTFTDSELYASRSWQGSRDVDWSSGGEWDAGALLNDIGGSSLASSSERDVFGDNAVRPAARPADTNTAIAGRGWGYSPPRYDFSDTPKSLRPAPRPAYQGANVSTAPFSSPYRPSALFSAFHTTPKRGAPAPVTTPASVRRKVWGGEAGASEGEGAFASRTAKVMAGLIGIGGATVPDARVHRTPPTLTATSATAVASGATFGAAAAGLARSSASTTSATGASTPTAASGATLGAAAVGGAGASTASVTGTSTANPDPSTMAAALPQTRPAAKAPVTATGSRPRGRPPKKQVVPVAALGNTTNQPEKEGVARQTVEGEVGKTAGGEGADGDEAASVASTLRYSVTNNTIQLDKQVKARMAKAALEKEEAEKKAAQAAAVAKGWAEIPNPGQNGMAISLTTRTRRPKLMYDGSQPKRQVKGTRPKNPHAASEKALLERSSNSARGGKRGRSNDEPTDAPKGKRARS